MYLIEINMYADIGHLRKGNTMRAILATVALCLIAATSQANTNNEVMKKCVQAHSTNWNKASACYFDWKQGKNAEQLAELRDFLKHNPRYKVPGQSLNRCWGKPREMPFESAGIETNGTSMRAWVNYKDKLPAGCYENAPWDNRDVEN